ncbi:hypothetical protein SBADM41S_03077 [Streptomyces badius]
MLYAPTRQMQRISVGQYCRKIFARSPLAVASTPSAASVACAVPPSSFWKAGVSSSFSRR